MRVFFVTPKSLFLRFNNLKLRAICDFLHFSQIIFCRNTQISAIFEKFICECTQFADKRNLRANRK